MSILEENFDGPTMILSQQDNDFDETHIDGELRLIDNDPTTIEGNNMFQARYLETNTTRDRNGYFFIVKMVPPDPDTMFEQTGTLEWFTEWSPAMQWVTQSPLGISGRNTLELKITQGKAFDGEYLEGEIVFFNISGTPFTLANPSSFTVDLDKPFYKFEIVDNEFEISRSEDGESDWELLNYTTGALYDWSVSKLVYPQLWVYTNFNVGGPGYSVVFEGPVEVKFDSMSWTSDGVPEIVLEEVYKTVNTNWNTLSRYRIPNIYEGPHYATTWFAPPGSR